MSGPDPIDRERRRADPALMTLLLSPPVTRTPSRQFGRDSLEDLRDRIERSDYAIEPDRVAEAMLERLRRP